MIDGLRFRVLRADSRRLHSLLVEKLKAPNERGGRPRGDAPALVAVWPGRARCCCARCWAALRSLGFAPFYFWLVPVLTLGVLAWLVERAATSTRAAAVLGFCFGLGYFSPA